MASNKYVVPEAKESMNKFKMEAATDVGVTLKNGYNGDLTSKQAGSIGGQMVKKMCTIRTASYERKNRSLVGHVQTVQYAARLCT